MEPVRNTVLLLAKAKRFGMDSAPTAFAAVHLGAVLA